MQRYSTLTPLLMAIYCKHIIISKLDKIQIFVALIQPYYHNMINNTNKFYIIFNVKMGNIQLLPPATG